MPAAFSNPLPESRHSHPDTMGTSTNGMSMRRAGCGGSRTSGSEGGQEKPTSRKAGRALLSDPYTYVWTLAGFVYVSFCTGVFSRMILGWTVSGSKSTRLVSTVVQQALAARFRANTCFTATGIVHHADYAEVFVKPRNRVFACA